VPKQYTVKNNQTGQSVTFQWHDETAPPTEADIEEVFAQAGKQQQPASQPGFFSQFLQQRAPAQDKLTFNHPEEGRRAVDMIKNNPGTIGAMAAGAIAAPFTAGMSVPAMMATEGAFAAGGNLTGNMIGKTAKGEKLDPAELASDAAKEGFSAAAFAGIGPALRKGGEELYHMALRPRISMSHTPEDVAAMVKTGIDEGINVSRGGFQKAGQLIESEANEVRKLVKGLNATGDIRQGLKKIAALKQTWLSRGALDEKIAALDDVAEQYTRRYGGDMSPEALHDLKQGVWHETQNNWDRSLNPAKIEAQKEFGSGIRQEIEDIARSRGVPDIAERNARIGRVGDLQDVISGRAVHQDFPGLKQGVEMAVGGTPGMVMRAVATSAPVISSAGRKIAKLGDFLDPRTYAPVASHLITDERRLLGPGAVHLGAGEDPSFVRGVAAEANPRPVRGLLGEGRTVHPMGPIPDDSGRIPVSMPEHYGKQAGGLDIPIEGEAYAPNGLDNLDIPADRDMYTPEELWMKKMLVEREPKLVHLPFQKWKTLLKQVAESDAYKSSVQQVEAQPGVRVTKDKVQDLYRRYISQR
jgi:hypothetical protein